MAPLLMRDLCLYLSLCLGLLWQPAWAADANAALGCSPGTATGSTNALSDLVKPHSQVAVLTRHGVPVEVGVSQIEQDAAQPMAAFNPRTTYPADPQRVMWLQLTVRADQPVQAGQWILELSKPFIDRIEFYTCDDTLAPPQWRSQVAGDHIAQNTWPVRSLYPQFVLPAMQPGLHRFYLKVQNGIALHFSVSLQTAEVVAADTQARFIQGGFILGFLVLMFFASGILVLTYRKMVYLWYAVFVAINTLAVASHLGFANYALWPHASWWPEYSVVVLVCTGLVVQLQFCRAMFLAPSTHERLHGWVSGVQAVCVCLVLLSLVTPQPFYRSIQYGFVTLACTGVTFYIVLRAVYQRSQTGWFWLLAYTPLWMIVVLAGIDSLGFAPVNELPLDAPLYALMFEMPVLLVALHLHAKSLHSHDVRLRALATAGGPTGFVPPANFARTAQGLWSQAKAQGKDLAVACVQVLHDVELAPLEDAARADQERAQVVRLLRTVVRTHDTVAQINDRQFACFLPGMSGGDDFNGRLSRLVALGLMAARDGPAFAPLRFRVVASTRSSAGSSWPALLTAFQRKLQTEADWGSRTIVFMGAVPQASMPEDEMPSELWAQALDKSPGQVRNQNP